MDERHIRNIPAITESDMERLAKSHVLVAGCGGLGGYVIEMLARAGIGRITCADGDIFAVSDLNRQILCTAANLGGNKALAAAERIRLIDPSIRVNAVPEFLTTENTPALMAEADIAIDCLDSIESRLMLEDAASDAGIPLVHGAISGWEFQAMLVPPGRALLHDLYFDAKEDTAKTSLSFTPAACASIEATLAVKYLCIPDAGADCKLYIGSLNSISLDTLMMR